MNRTTVAVSGKTYYAALDPLATNVPDEEGWPPPTHRKIGRGSRFTYDLTTAQAREMTLHLRELGGTFVEGDDDLTRAEGRAIVRDAVRIESELRDLPCGWVHSDPLCGCYVNRVHTCGPSHCRECDV